MRKNERECGRMTRFPLRGGWMALGSFVFTLGLGLSSPRAGAQATFSLAEVNGEVITAETIEQALGAKLAKLEEQIYHLKREQLDTLITQRLLAQEAAKRGMSIAGLLDAEVTAKVALVTETEIDAFYQANKARLTGGDEAATRQKIRASLQQEKLAAQQQRFVDSLRSQAKIHVRLQPPAVVRVEVPIDGAPVRGGADAPVTLVEFSDFHCPFCKRVQATLIQLLERYPQKIRLVYRDFPLEALHPQARRAAEAARGAHDQGKFWDYHDVLFTHAPRATPDDLKRYAEQVGLDVTEFDRCQSGSVHQAAVQRDLDEGSRLGITGTPAFFINGRFLSGAQPLEGFVRVIEEELARTAVGGGKTDKKG